MDNVVDEGRRLNNHKVIIYFGIVAMFAPIVVAELFCINIFLAMSVNKVGATVYRVLAQKHGIAFRTVPRNKNHKTMGTLHLNNVNAYDKRLKEWMDRFHGVAKKNLEIYLGWNRWLDAARKRMTTARKFLSAAIR